MIDIFIPSYHRAKNLKTVKYFLDLGWKSDKLHVFIDTEDDQVDLYRAESDKHGFHLHIFDIDKVSSLFPVSFNGGCLIIEYLIDEDTDDAPVYLSGTVHIKIS